MVCCLCLCVVGRGVNVNMMMGGCQHTGATSNDDGRKPTIIQTRPMRSRPVKFEVLTKYQGSSMH